MIRILNRRAVRIGILAALVGLGAVLRLTDINWDRYQHLHPDERFIVWVASTMRWPPGEPGADEPASFLGELRVALDPPRSPLNPLRWPPDAGDNAGKVRNYAYGHFPLYLLLGVANVAAAVGRGDWGLGIGEWAPFPSPQSPFPSPQSPVPSIQHLVSSLRHLADYSHLTLVGRGISAFADLGTLLLVYAITVRIARRMGGQGTGDRQATAPGAYATGLLAAAAYAFAVLPIQLSHYAAVDALLTFCVTATVALAARYAEQGDRLAWAGAGVAAGLAVGSKFSAVLLAIPLLAAALLAPPGLARPGSGPWQAQLLGRSWAFVRRVVPMGLIAFFTFAVTNPFALLEFDLYIGQILSQNAMVSGVMDAPYTRQYIGTIPYGYFVRQLSQWGLTWPLGLVAWAGLVWAALRFGLGRASAGATVLLAWALPYFLATGGFHTKFLRYMAPLLPFLLAFGAVFALAGRSWLVRRWDRLGRWVWTAAAAGTLVLAAGWAVAFTSVYRQEHPWIEASRWIHSNVPAGAKVLSEAWDDSLPLAMDEIADRPPARLYERAELPVWDPDDPAKVERLAEELASGDFLAVASPRAYAPMARLAGRYPMTSAYYRQLFAGELGYEVVATFSAYPRIGPLVIRDDHADESFSVYDHPRTLIFRNTGRLTSADLASRLGQYLPARGAAGAEDEPLRPAGSHRPAGLASLAPAAQGPGPSLLLPVPVESLPDVTDFRWNRLASTSPIVAVLLWWLVIAVFGWIAWPLLFPLMAGLADRGHGLSRAVGWLLVGWVHWMGVSLGLWLNALGPLLMLLLALVVLARLRWAAQRPVMAHFWGSHGRLILGQEALFAGAYLVFVVVRLLNPDLWHPWNGGEKFMESAFLNATLRSPVFPPYDPYFAGGTINYYYFGLYLVGLPIRLSGIATEVAFNLATPALFAMSAVAAFSIAYSLACSGRGARRRVRPALVGALAVLLTLCIGNLTGLEWALAATAGALRGIGAPSFDYWAASRVIPYTINEFPLWTFTFADLHPHLISMPFGLAVLGLSYAGYRHTPPGALLRVARLAALALALGAIGAINTWDLPTYALVVLAAFLLLAWRTGGLGRERAKALLIAAGAAVFVALAAVLAYAPFYASYRAQVGDEGAAGVARYLGWVRDGSDLRSWLLVWGLFLFLVASYGLVEWLVRRVSAEARGLAHAGRGRAWLFGALGLVALTALVAALGRPTVALAVLPLCLVLPALLDREADPGRAFVALLLAAGLAVVAGAELVYLRDFLDGGDWYRMNTVFKFSVPAWILLGLAGGFALARLWSLAGRVSAWLAVPWLAAAGLLLAGGLVFPAAGIRDRVTDRSGDARPAVGTLDGMAYMTVGAYAWPSGDSRIDLSGDHDAIKWLLDNVSGTPVVAEAPAGSYQVGNEWVSYDYYRAGGLRVASLTGLPTFVGQHQYEQRSADQVSLRAAKGAEFFRTTDLSAARRLARELQVRLIYVGQLERVLFSEASLRKFDVLAGAGELEIAYRSPDVTIYRVVD